MQNSEKKEHPSTYVVQDRQNQQELTRLTIQDQVITASMGGVLPEQPDPGAFKRVLDVGCGSGNWIIEAAKTYPTMWLAGIDVSLTMIQYARAQAEEQQLSERVEFRVMDALRMLEFPAGYFDLVNIRFGVSFLRTWDWPRMLGEMLRVTRPGGTVRVTDEEIVHENNSPALTRYFNEMLLCGLFKAGHLFEQESKSLTNHLPPLMKQHVSRQVQTKAYPLEFRAGTPAGQAYYEDVEHMFHIMRPFVQKWGCISDEYSSICKQALSEMQQSDFHSTWNLLTVWGVK
jgi:ubiquinone/menaquinone biosynthesis C-methylase UbiE